MEGHEYHARIVLTSQHGRTLYIPLNSSMHLEFSSSLPLQVMETSPSHEFVKFMIQERERSHSFSETSDQDEYPQEKAIQLTFHSSQVRWVSFLEFRFLSSVFRCGAV